MKAKEITNKKRKNKIVRVHCLELWHPLDSSHSTLCDEYVCIVFV